MNIIIKTTNFSLTPSIKKYVDLKLKPVEKFILSRRKEKALERTLFSFDVELSLTSRHHKKGNIFCAETTIRMPKKIIRAESLSSDLRLAINKLKDILIAELKKYKEKKRTSMLQGARKRIKQSEFA